MEDMAANRKIVASRLFSRAMAHARERSGLTQEALAARLGIDQSVLARRESGQKAPLESSLESTAHGLGISVRQMLLAEVAPHELEGRTFDLAERHVLSSAVRGARMHKGLTQEALAKELGVFPAAVSKIEGGGRHLGEDTIERVAQALGMPIEEFLRVGLLYQVGPPPPSGSTDLRARLRALIDGGTVSASQVADEVGVHRSQVSRFLGGAALGEATAGKLAEVLSKLEPRA